MTNYAIEIHINHNYINIFSLEFWFFYCRYIDWQLLFVQTVQIASSSFLKLVSPIFTFCLFLFIYFFFLLGNLFGICKKSVMFFFKPSFIIFQKVISFSILTIAISKGNLGLLNMIRKVASICVQWLGQKAKKFLVISIITLYFFI